ncbi:MAG: ECF-type sigma factor [Burkholderiales bacterium]
MSEDTDPNPSLPQAMVDELYEAAYRDLRRMAHARLRDGGRNTVLDTTALVHESFLRLSQREDLRFPDRARFLSYAGRAMRSIIVDIVRQRRTERADGGLRITLHTDWPEVDAGEEQILDVHEALDSLAQIDPRMAQVVEMRWFGGLAEVEIAAALGVTERTVRRDWAAARLFLAEALEK